MAADDDGPEINGKVVLFFSISDDRPHRATNPPNVLVRRMTASTEVALYEVDSRP
jgi:hypothetical protein